jgi:hypothetical protein
MKKVLTFATAASMLAFIACGPSAEEKAKADKHMKDSLSADSAAKATAKMNMQKMHDDSVAKAKMASDSGKTMPSDSGKKAK